MRIFLLDNGHGKDTPGKRSPVWPDGRQLFEYEFARDMVRRIKAAAVAQGLFTVELVPELEDVPLADRVKRANRWHELTDGRCVLLSIHANAGGGTGFEVYTSPGKTASDKYATALCEQLKGDFPGIKFRSDWADGDADKEADFYILKKTACPAMLAELLFMDNKTDCERLFDGDFRQKMAESIVRALHKINKL